MVAFSSVAASALLAITPVLAAVTNSPTHLFARQINGFDPSTIPTSCLQSQCQALINIFSTNANNGCTTLDCLCTSSVASALQTCVQCESSIGATGVNATTAQQALSEFEQGCSEAGHPVSVSGQSGGGTTKPSNSASGSSGTGSSGTSGSGATSASGATTTAGSTTNQKSDAIVRLGISIVGSIAAFALGGLNVF